MWIRKKLKELESNLNFGANFNEYTKCISNLELSCEKITKGVTIRSKCQWYEEGEESTKFFLKFEKKEKRLVRKFWNYT